MDLRYPYLKLIDEAQVGGVHQADVIDAPAQHSGAIQTHAKGEAPIFVWVYPRVFEHVGVDHPRAHQLYPPVPQFFGSVRASDAHIHLYRWLGKRKEARTKTDFDIFKHALQ